MRVAKNVGRPMRVATLPSRSAEAATPIIILDVKVRNLTGRLRVVANTPFSSQGSCHPTRLVSP